jgi:hypothetical protein
MAGSYFPQLNCTEEFVDAFFTGGVSRFGVLKTVTSERGANLHLPSGRLYCMCSKPGVHYKLTTTFHPQAYGMVERFNSQLIQPAYEHPWTAKSSCRRMDDARTEGCAEGGVRPSFSGDGLWDSAHATRGVFWNLEHLL